MDRPFLKKKKIIFFTLLFVLCCPLLQTARAEENNNKIKKSSNKKKEKVVKSSYAIEGLFLGVVKSVDSKLRFFEAISLIPDTEKIFYIDEETIIKKNWKKIQANALVPNDQVKVVYFKKDQTLLANIVTVEKEVPLLKDPSLDSTKANQKDLSP